MNEQPLTHVTKASHLPWAIYNLFFKGMRIAYGGKELQIQMVTPRNGGTIKTVQVGDYMYLEQNKLTSSKYAYLAKKGRKILWIVHVPTGKYVGRVIDGDVKPL